MDPNAQTAQALLEQALEHLQSAIALLDRAGAPGQIAAHADLAANQLADLLLPAEAKIMRVQLDDENPGTDSTFWRPRPH